MSKNHLKQLLLISDNAEDNKKLQCLAFENFFQRTIFNAYLQFRALYTYTCENFSENLLEPKRMQVLPLKLQYQKKMIGLFKKKSIEAYEFHLPSNIIVRPTL